MNAQSPNLSEPTMLERAFISFNELLKFFKGILFITRKLFLL